MQFIREMYELTGFNFLNIQQVLMIGIGMVLIYLAVAKGFEPLLLIPIGFGVVVGNMPFNPADGLSVYSTILPDHTVLGNGLLPDGKEAGTPHGTFAMLYFLVRNEVFPPLIFLGIGALTDFSYMISNPRLILLGAAAQVGVFVTFLGAVLIGDHIPGIRIEIPAAAAIGIIGGADGPTSIYIANRMAQDWMGPIAIAAYSYMSLVPVIQPPIMRLLTTREERLIRMKPPREVSRTLKIMFPVIGFVICSICIPSSLVLMGCLFLGNLLRESGCTDRLAKTIAGPFIDTVTVLLGFCVGLGTTWNRFLDPTVLMIFALGAFAFASATAGGVLFAKLMNKFSKEPINPLIGSAGVSAVPMAARVSQMVATEEDPHNYILMHAMAPNVAGVIGTAVAAGVFIAMIQGQ